jgi:hypothetical protein
MSPASLVLPPGDGAFAHAGIAVEDVFAVTEGEEGGEKAGSGACVADEEFGFGGGDFPAQACDGHFVVGFVQLNVEAEGLKGFGKVTRVVGEEGVDKAGLSAGEGGDEQGAVGQRLGTRDAHGGGKRMWDGEDAHWEG